jgi:hypothetical protein
MNWFYEYNGEQKGPVTESELDSLIAQGVVLPTTLVWRDGLAGWTPLERVRTASPAGGFTPAAGTTRCDSCGRFFEAGDVVQIAGRNICASCKPAVLQGLQQGTTLTSITDPLRNGPAWEHRETLGFWVATRDTVKAVLLEPSQAFSTMRVDGGISKPFWFNLIFAGIGNVTLFLILSLAQAGMGSLNPALRGASGMPEGVAGVMFVFQLIWSFVGVAIGTFLQSGIIHVCLMICGGARRPFEATYRAIAYGSGSVALLNLIPIVGSIAAIPWSIIVSCIGLSRTHETDLWRVVLAIFLPAIVCCVLILIIVGITVGVSSGSHH